MKDKRIERADVEWLDAPYPGSLPRIKGPLFTDGCEHAGDQYIASFDIIRPVEGKFGYEYYDLYAFPGMGGATNLCIRYGNSPEEYISLGPCLTYFLTEVTIDGVPDPIYQRVLEILREDGRFYWKPREKKPAKDALLCLIAGFEHSGTTPLSELIRQHPGVDGRFETGFLMGDTPADFESTGAFPEFVRDFWGVSEEDMVWLRSSASFDEMYKILRSVSNLPDKTVQIYDKAPAYMGRLRKVMSKVDVPVVVIVKDPRAILASIRDRGVDRPPQQVARHLDHYTREYLAAKAEYGDRILLVRSEHLCTEPEKYGKMIYDHIGLEWRDEYALLKDVYPLHDNCYGNENKDGTSLGLVGDRLQEWKENLAEDEVGELMKHITVSDHWYWEPGE